MTNGDTVNFAPKGWRTITPRIVARDARSLVEFVKHVFDGAPTVQHRRFCTFTCATPTRRIELLSRQAPFQWRSRETYRTEIGVR
jgi:hypothetical protein